MNIGDINLLNIVRDCISNNEESQDKVVSMLKPIGENILKRFQNLSREDKEDILQDSFKTLFSKVRNFRGSTVSELKSYFGAIVFNEARTYWKKMQSHTRKEIPIDGIKEESISNPNSNINIIQYIFKILTIEEKEIVILKIKEYKDKEISEILNIPLGTVASKWNRIKEKLKKKIEKNGRSNNFK